MQAYDSLSANVGVNIYLSLGYYMSGFVTIGHFGYDQGGHK